MKSGKIAVLLLTMIIIGIGASGILHAGKAPKPSAPAPSAVSPNADVDIVYYFMTTQRCPSCMKIEAFTRETVNAKFGDALKKGRMIWRMVNVDQPENTHFIKDYQLYTKSVVLVKIRKGKQVEWKNLDQVWPLLKDKNAFQAYIQKEVKTFVEKG